MFRRSFMALMLMAMGARGGRWTAPSLPVTPPVPDYKLPPTFETKLPNGLTVVLLEDRRFPMVTVRLGFRRRLEVRPEGDPRTFGNRGRAAHRGHAHAHAAADRRGTRGHRRIALRRVRARTASRSPATRSPNTRPSCWSCWRTWRATPASREEEIKLRIQNRKQELAGAALAALLPGRREARAGRLRRASVRRTSRPPWNRSTASTARRWPRFRTSTWRRTTPTSCCSAGSRPARRRSSWSNEHFGSWQRKEPPATPKAEFPDKRPQARAGGPPGLRAGRYSRRPPRHHSRPSGLLPAHGGALHPRRRRQLAHVHEHPREAGFRL